MKKKIKLVESSYDNVYDIKAEIFYWDCISHNKYKFVLLEGYNIVESNMSDCFKIQAEQI